MHTTTRLNGLTGMLTITVIQDDIPGSMATFQMNDDGTGWGWVPCEDANHPDHTLRIPVDMAESIMAALLLHFGIPDPATKTTVDYQVEYLAERDRVDKLLDAVVSLAG